jgi:excisionase family DNA binding protein
MNDRQVLVRRREAAELLGVSLRHFQRHIQPQLPCVYSGQLRLFRVRDLERWADSRTGIA